MVWGFDMIIKKRMGLVFILLLVAGCDEAVVQPGPTAEDRSVSLQPLTAQALPAEAVQVENLVRDAFAAYWQGSQDCEPALTFSVIADEASSAWANFAMRDLSSEPRAAWNNTLSYRYRRMTEDPWNAHYRAILTARRALSMLDEGAEVGSGGRDTVAARALATFVQGLSQGFLALMFDQAFLIEGEDDLTRRIPELKPYPELMAGALLHFDDAIALSENNTFRLPFDWIFGLEPSSDQLARLIHSYSARYRAQAARTPEERAAVDWNAVLEHLDTGIIDDFRPISDGNFGTRYDCLKDRGQEGETWTRADYRTIGPADESGGFQAWEATPLQDRLVFDIFTSDRRIVGSDVDPSVDGKDFEYQGTNGPFPPSRGTYHYSSHNHKRYQDYRESGRIGPMPVMLVAEMDMLRAEALLRTGGSTDDVAALINNTRVERGELNPATGDDDAGTHEDAQSHLDTASLWAKLKHEKRIETFHTAGGLSYFDDRGWGDLVTNTPIHFPIPAKALELLFEANYTFGGGGDGSASKARSQRERPDRPF